MYRNHGIETKERKLVETAKHALAINDEEPSANPPEEAAVHALLVSLKPGAAMREREREETELLHTS